jgi:23S rRNA (cytidine1920-2'-O)/16S rRNA (cytidine1409-2'-O)-methyltransferase
MAEFIAVDVSFISAALVLPPVVSAAFPENKSGRELVVLVKPQFEAGRGQVGKGGIVRDPGAHTQAVEKVSKALIDLGARSTDVIDSPILGAEGNKEFLLCAAF